MKMKMKNFLRVTAGVSVVMLMTASLFGCGKKAEVKEEAKNNIVPKASSEAQNTQDEANGESSRPQKQYEVILDERAEKERYVFGIDDISFVDTVNGQKISIGMTIEELEAVTGKSMTDDANYRVYDGLIVQFSDEGKAVSMIVSGGMFPNDEQATRYMSVRGVGINTSFDDFAKAYGDIYSKAGEGSADAPANAIRYFKVNGDKVEYLGDKLTEDIKQESNKNNDVYVQYFMFEEETNTVSAMRVSRYDYLGK